MLGGFRAVNRLGPLPIRPGLFSCLASTSAIADVVQVACVLERNPLLKPLLDDWEAEYKAWAEKFRFRKSKTLPIEFLEGKRSAGDDGDEEEVKKMAAWRPNPRVTQADEEGNTKSMLRCLDTHLFLIVKSEDRWEFPAGGNQEGETVRETAERVLEETMGSSFQTYVLGNCPFGHLGEPKDRKGPLFYQRAKIVKGEVSLSRTSGWKDYAWVSKAEIPKYLLDEEEQKMLNIMLPNVHKKRVTRFW